MLCFRHKHSKLTFKTLQGLDQKKDIALNSNTTSKVYENLKDLLPNMLMALLKYGTWMNLGHKPTK